MGKRFRVLGWMYVVPLVLFVIVKGRGYYLAGAYPMLYAAGSVWGEQWLASVRRGAAVAIRALAWTALAADIAIAGAFTLPVARVNSKWWNVAVKANGDLREEVGWPELVQTVAKIRDSLPAQERDHLGILAGNYGEAGAIDLYGPRYGLPAAISGINSFWLRGYGEPPGSGAHVEPVRGGKRRDARPYGYFCVPGFEAELAGILEGFSVLRVVGRRARAGS
jgi:hypothetical protein